MRLARRFLPLLLLCSAAPVFAATVDADADAAFVQGFNGNFITFAHFADHIFFWNLAVFK